MPCAAMFLNLLSQGGHLTVNLVLTTQVYHRITRRLTPVIWVLAQTHCAITGTAGSDIYTRRLFLCKG